MIQRPGMTRPALAVFVHSQVKKHYDYYVDLYQKTEAETDETEPENWPPYVRAGLLLIAVRLGASDGWQH